MKYCMVGIADFGTVKSLGVDLWRSDGMLRMDNGKMMGSDTGKLMSSDTEKLLMSEIGE